jgi:hypothetical protein
MTHDNRHTVEIQEISKTLLPYRSLVQAVTNSGYGPGSKLSFFEGTGSPGGLS